MLSVKGLAEYAILYAFLAYTLVVALFKYLLERIRGGRVPVNLAGKSVLITGAAGGVGRATAFEFARQGCHLALLDVNKGDAQRLTSEVKAEFPELNVRFYTCDLTNAQQLQQVLTTVRRDFNNVDILINNAGVANGKSFEDLTQKDWELTFGVNAMSHFSTVHALLPGMISSGYGHIVSVASILGIYGFAPRCADYAASKFAAVGFMEALEYELHSRGVTFVGLSTVCPFMIDTPLFAGTVPSRFRNAMPILTPEYVAKNIVDSVKNRRRLITLPMDLIQFPIIKLLLPKSVLFAVADFSGHSRSMEGFVGRNGTGNGVHRNGEIASK